MRDRCDHDADHTDSISRWPTEPFLMELLALLEELRAMARTGLNFADDPYDRERYERILELVAEYYGASLDVPPEEVRERLADELGQVTPKVGADAVVFDRDGKVLLMKRPDRGPWCLPGGAVKVNESPEEAVLREAREETGLSVEPETLVGVYRREPTSGYPHSVILLPYLCTVTGGTLELSHEGEDLQYWAIEDVPEWLPNHRQIATDALNLQASGEG